MINNKTKTYLEKIANDLQIPVIYLQAYIEDPKNTQKAEDLEKNVSEHLKKTAEKTGAEYLKETANALYNISNEALCNFRLFHQKVLKASPSLSEDLDALENLSRILYKVIQSSNNIVGQYLVHQAFLILHRVYLESFFDSNAFSNTM